MKTALKLLAAGTASVLVAIVSLSSSVTTKSIPTVLAASSDYYLKIDGIEGNIAIESFSWGVSNTLNAGSGLATGKRQYQPLIIRKRVDKSTPLLFKAANDGKDVKNLKTVTLTQPGSEGKAGYTMVFTDVIISSYQHLGDLGSSPVENISFTYQKIEMK